MIIDIHTHTFPDRIARAAIDKLSKAAHAAAFTDASNQSLLSSMEKAGIDLSVIAPVATSPAQVEKIKRKKRREFIQAKIKEERLERYKEKQRNKAD